MQWLVTGCSTGLGLDIARAALQSGQKCIATSRNPDSSPQAVEEIKRLGGAWAKLDVSSSTLENDLQKIVEAHGPVDVIINNAGLDAARKMFETNFFGPIRVIQTLLPAMREKKAGTIVNISSATFWSPPPTASVYAASKFALEALSEGLAGELSAFNIRVMTVQPGGMRTAFFDPEKLKLPALPEAYKGTIAEYAMQAIAGLHGTAAQDPKKTAEVIVQEVLKPMSDPPLLRLSLGKESVGALRKRIEDYTKTADQVESVASTCDF